MAIKDPYGFENISGQQDEDGFEDLTPKGKSFVDIHRAQESNEPREQPPLPPTIMDRYRKGMEFLGKYTPLRVPMMYADMGKQIAGIPLAAVGGLSTLAETAITGNPKKTQQFAEKWIDPIMGSHTPEGKAIEEVMALPTKAGLSVGTAYQDIVGKETQYDPGRILIAQFGENLERLPKEDEKYKPEMAKLIAAYKKRGDRIAPPSALEPFMATALGTGTTTGIYSLLGKIPKLVGGISPKGEVKPVFLRDILEHEKAPEMLVEMARNFVRTPGRGHSNLGIELAQRVLTLGDFKGKMQANILKAQDIAKATYDELRTKAQKDPELFEQAMRDSVVKQSFTEALQFIETVKTIADKKSLDEMKIFKGGGEWGKEAQIFLKTTADKPVDFVKLHSDLDRGIMAYLKEAPNEKFQRFIQERTNDRLKANVGNERDVQGSGQAPGIQTSGRPSETGTAPTPETVTPPQRPIPASDISDLRKAPTTPSQLITNMAERAKERGQPLDITIPETAIANMKAINDQVTEMYKTDPERVTRIAMGEEAPPKGMYIGNFFKAIEDNATKKGDLDALIALSKAPVAEISQEAGRTIKSFDYSAEGSPVRAMRDLRKTRTESVQKRLGKIPVEKIKNDITNQIKAEIQKVASKPKDWADLVRSLQCPI